MNLRAKRQGNPERIYIEAMSREPIVSAYSRWTKLSNAEQLCFERHLPSGSRILDLGCGTGRALTALKGNCKSYFGIDASPSMIQAARAQHPDSKFAIGDIVNIKCKTASVDAVLLLHNVIDMLYPISRRAVLLQNVHRIVKQNGIVIASSHLRRANESRGYFKEEYHGAEIRNYRSSLPEWCGEIEAAGFCVLLAMRDYRQTKCDWTYIAAIKRGH